MDENDDSSRRPRCRCNLDIYRNVFGPTPDESFLILFLLLLEILDRWKCKYYDLENQVEEEEVVEEEVQTCIARITKPRRKRRPYGFR